MLYNKQLEQWNMVTSEDRKKKLQLKVQLHYKTPKKEKMSK